MWDPHVSLTVHGKLGSPNRSETGRGEVAHTRTRGADADATTVTRRRGAELAPTWTATLPTPTTAALDSMVAGERRLLAGGEWYQEGAGTIANSVECSLVVGDVGGGRRRARSGGESTGVVGWPLR